jgi:hypothetical protein
MDARSVAEQEQKYVVPLSGGKDSTAVALYLAEFYSWRNYTYIFNETGDDFDALTAHLLELSQRLGKPIERVGCGKSLNDLIQIQNALPSWRMRWCTRMLKIEPTIAWLRQNAPATVYVGLRADEEERDGIYGDIPGITFEYPLRNLGWGVDEVWRYLGMRQQTIPWRTNCRRCYDQRLSEWWELWKTHKQAWAEAEAQETATGHTFRSPQRDSWPAPLAELRKKFEAGEIPRGVDLQLPMFGEANMQSRCRVCSL